MWKRVAVLVLAAGLAAPSGGCSDTAMGLSSEGFRQIGVLQFETTRPVTASVGGPDRAILWTVPPEAGFVFPPAAIEAPDTVAVNQTFEVVVNTIGMSGCWREDGAEQSQANAVVTITPYDLHSGAEICTTVLGLLRHSVQVKLDRTGGWMLRANGRRVRGAGTSDSPVAAARPIYVK